MKKSHIIILLIAIPIFIFAFGKIEQKKELKKTWNVTSDTKVILQNKYGDIDIKTWDKNKVSITVTITVKVKDKDDAEKVFDRIEVNFSEGTDYVKAKTVIKPKKTGLFDWFSSWSSDNYTIDWLVYMPKANDVDLQNKYGDTYMVEMDGDLDLDIKYGGLFLDKSNGLLNFELGYGEAKIDYLNTATIQIKYSELNIIKGEKTVADTKYSDISIKNIEDLVIDSKYDDYSIENINTLVYNGKYSDIDIKNLNSAEIDAGYTDIEIKKLYEKLNVNCDYGSVEILGINDDFDKINIDAKYTDVELKPGKNIDFTGDFSVSYGDIKLPGYFVTTYHYIKSYSEEIKGYSGNADTKSSISIKLVYDDIEIK